MFTIQICIDLLHMLEIPGAPCQNDFNIVVYFIFVEFAPNCW
jgi:hypothetical protein